MTSVTLDCKDVEALLFSVNAIQGVEAALIARSRDPMVQSAKGRLSQAHDSIAAEWRRAQRTEPEKPSEQDLRYLQRLFQGTASDHRPFVLLDHYPQRLAQTLQLVESGQYFKGIKIDWPPPHAPEFSPNDLGIKYAARLTPRGLSYLRNMPPLLEVLPEEDSPSFLDMFGNLWRKVRG